MIRDALVVGINIYHWAGLKKLRSPATDAEAIAQQLGQDNNFQIWRLPEFHDPLKGNVAQVARNVEVTFRELEDALIRLFLPQGRSIPDTALFYFSGHGLRKERGIPEGYLATSDVDPDQEKWGIRLKGLRELLQESPVRQQIVWLDCCYSGEFFNFEEANPGDKGEARDRCFIAACREFEESWQDVSGSRGESNEAAMKCQIVLNTLLIGGRIILPK